MKYRNLIQKLKIEALFQYLSSKGYLRGLTDYTFLKIQYRIKMREYLNLKNPKTFNEKIQWLKLYDRVAEYTQMVDKYEVREYIKKTIGEKYLIPLYNVWDNVDEINWNSLPQQFVLKCTHDSGGLVICKDKEKLNIKTAKEKIKKSLQKNYFHTGREWVYKDVKPRIIAEKYMEDKNTQNLKDYKFFCFNGEVKMTLVVADINSKQNVKRNFYNRDWELMPLKEGTAPNTNENIKKPVNYEKMIEIAEILSKDIPFVRVDLYEIDNKIYFGELTFYPNNGNSKFNPKKYDEILGSWITLPEKSN